jgi:glutamate-5-semialdehyde dehydrogenase
MTTAQIIENAVKAKYAVAVTDSEHKNLALKEMSNALRNHKAEILAANELDIEAAKEHISPVMIDRLTLTEARIDAMADSLLDVVALPDPVGRILETETRKDGLQIAKISVPLGVLAMIYESRPNVTSDAAALALKSGNVCILRGGKEAINSNKAIVTALKTGLKNANFPEDAIGLVTDTTRQSATELMTATGKIDMLIPRGGAGLIRSCVENAKVPCIETGTGICHVFVDADADLRKAIKIIENAKTSRPSVCNAAEVLLVHESIVGEFLPLVKKCLTDDRATNKVELRLCEEALKVIDGTPASPTDFDTEFLDFILAVKVVKNVDEAIEHIRAHSTGHSEAIITENEATANKFTSFIDSAAVYVNASTRFTDGGEFGLGCEMGISTQKLHARGPMGLKELTSYKYIIKGNGHIR